MQNAEMIITVTHDLGNLKEWFSAKRQKNFWKRVGKLGTEAGCWLWTSSVDKDGYGRFECGTHKLGTGKTWRAHRYAFTLFRGLIPEGQLVCHHCDTPGCVNPVHLFLGSIQLNNMDRELKDRTSKGERHRQATIAGQPPVTDEMRLKHLKNLPRGDDHPRAVVTVEKVREIRRLFFGKIRTKRELEKHYGVSYSCIDHIVKFRVWKNA